MEKYEEAACRHYRDARTLKENGGLDNAGHLIGFAAECAIKHRIKSLHPTNNAPHGHFPEILIAARKHLGQRSSYTMMYEILKMDVFIGWHVNRRYFSDGNTSTEEIEDWLKTTQRLFATANIKLAQ